MFLVFFRVLGLLRSTLPATEQLQKGQPQAVIIHHASVVNTSSVAAREIPFLPTSQPHPQLMSAFGRGLSQCVKCVFLLNVSFNASFS